MNKSLVEERFTDFYDKWMSKLEDLLQLLLVVSKEHHDSQDASHEAMVNKLTSHHKEYYTIKWAAAHEDVLAFFAPSWLSPLQNAYLWLTGWKPSMLFRLVESLRKAQFPGGTGSLAGLSEEQVRKIEALKAKMKVDEERVEREMERHQVAMADRKMVELVRLERVAKIGGDSEAAVTRVNAMAEVAMRVLLGDLEKVMKMADCVRLKTLKGVLDVLSPMQSVEFLAASSMLQIQMRKWGKKRELGSKDHSTQILVCQ